ncbi:hypothetical protein MXB_862, partial [Myxobolus squamalis]
MISESSRIRCNYDKECEDLINMQIREELKAQYNYINMAFHFHRDDVALMGFYNFFMKMSDEELSHAKALMKFQNDRGGRIILYDITAPRHFSLPNSLTPLASMEIGLEMEKH